jgi:sugar transferase (PEP-CTERM/EpsH1 system associated)
MRILFVHKQILFPRDTGGKIRVLNLMKHLPKWHDVTYVCNLRAGEERHIPEMEALGLRLAAVRGEPPKWGGARFFAGVAANMFSPRPFSIDRNFDPAVRAKVAGLLAAERFDLVICDTVQMARHVLGLPARATVLFQHNVEAQILRRHAEVSPGRMRRWYMHRQWRKMRRFESEAGGQFNHVIAVSEPDRLLFQREFGWRHVSAIETAVDTEFFTPRLDSEKSDRVVFVGSMDWLPNQDGVQWFAREVWPKVRAARPSAKFQIVGRNPPASVRALTKQSAVEVVGGVPDVRPHLAEATVVVVPLLVGGGTRLKIFEAMAMGRAVVSTAIGAEGLPLEADTHFLEASEPASFASAVLRLLSDGARRTNLGREAQAHVRERFGTEAIARQFDSICRAVVDAKSHSVPAHGDSQNRIHEIAPCNK